ncbi:MAG: ribonuclease HII [Gammaproteobacteria bacterium]|nr:ribonuclease HII [Gammaproteobacteria bacterium]MDE2346193.1 ribonuclease HII [Gammaproteobacteria bacterium]
MVQIRGIPNIIIAGVDEAGRGPLAGPVTAAAVVLEPAYRIAGLKDSKMLTPRRREQLAGEIRSHALAWAVGWADHLEIDRINILQAALLAMKRAILALSIRPIKVLVDGNRCPVLECETEAIVHGDNIIPDICAASILAKVERDAAMSRFDKIYPDYGFATHKGYGTALHLAALKKHGACPIHRRSFAPIRSLQP